MKLTLKNNYHTIRMALVRLLVLLLVLSSCSRIKPEKKEKNEEPENFKETVQATEVEAIVLEKRGFSKELSANGKISAINKVDVRTKLNEPVLKIMVNNGQWVEKGHIIAILDTFELYQGYLRQKVLFEKAKLDFSDKLIEMGYNQENMDEMPKQQRQNAEKRSGIIIAGTDFTIAREKYLSAFIKSPIDGKIANLSLNEGNYANNNFICTVIDNRRLKVDFYILEEESHIVSKSLKVSVSPFYNDKVVETGNITSINPTVENGLIRVSAELNSSSPALYDGITVKVYVKSAPRTCLAVPKEAIVLRTGKKVIFTYDTDEKCAKWNYVETGEENSTHVEITSGLNEMDTVIVSGNLHLGDNVPCFISNEKIK